jgi:hypothetical protein
MDKRVVIGVILILALGAYGCSGVSSSTGQGEESAKTAAGLPPAAATTQTASSDVQTATPEPVTPPEPAAGEIVRAADYEAAVGGGKYVTVGKKRYLALMIYVKSNGADLMWFDTSLAVEDQSGNLIDFDYPPLQKTSLVPPLDTNGYELQDGESTGGWVLFEMGKGIKPAYLVVGDAELAPDLEPLRISLAGLEAVSSKSAAAKAFAIAARIGGARASASSVTMQEYLLVKKGMSLKKVNSIVGFDGDELSRYGSYTSYSWANEDGGNMLVTFYRNRVQSKAQAGL